MFAGDRPKTGARRSAVSRFITPNGRRAVRIEWNCFPEHCFLAAAIFYVNSAGLRAGKGPGSRWKLGAARAKLL
jgi:hypothetical protein